MAYSSSTFGYSVDTKEEGRKRVICLKGTLADENPETKHYKRIPLRDGMANSGWRILDLTIGPTDASENNYNQDWTVQVATAPMGQPIARWDAQGSLLIAYAKCLFGAGALFGNFSQIDTDRIITYDIFIGAWDEVGSPDVAGINYIMHLEKVPLTKTAYALSCLNILEQFDTIPNAPYT
jgi:hypothetical protein|tara:strand:+ start:817 stop:1356 length:540 start_codon:yes stop_codon:yes gene_type:complete